MIPLELKLRAGEIVEVRSKEEILSTLNSDGSLDGLPFMPEMFQYSGRKFKVYKRADKTCDTITGKYVSRRMVNTVHLDNLRCGGEAHGGCDATCLLFWKEAWLKRPKAGPEINVSGAVDSPDEQFVWKATRRGAVTGNPAEEIFSCQATELLNASSPLVWWDVRQYVRELFSGNIGIFEYMRVLAITWFNIAHEKTRGWKRYPLLDQNLLMKKSAIPTEPLNLQPGEYVRIKSKEAILKTLNKRYRNRGLLFDIEMVRYCGRTAKVLKRVDKLINEGTGKMISIKNDCIVLEGVVCCGDLSEKRLFCPRNIYSFWREIWLERID